MGVVLAVARVPEVLVLRALGLGDLLTAVPALRGVAAAFPGHRVVLAAPAPLAPIAALTGAVDRLAPTGELEPVDPSAAGPEVGVNLHGRGPESHRVLLAARPRRVVAFHHPDVPGTAGFPRWRPGEHEVRRWCRLLEDSGIPADPGDLDLRPPREEPPRAARGATLLHPGAASPARRWPPDRWAAVARGEATAGRPVAITAGPGEGSLASRVAADAGLPPSAVLARMGLETLAAAVAGAARVVCGDTGVAHLATALGTPSVVLFGPTPPALWGPPADRPRHVALWAGRPGDPHGEETDPGLLRIRVEAVLEALEGLPDQAETEGRASAGASRR